MFVNYLIASSTILYRALRAQAVNAMIIATTESYCTDPADTLMCKTRLPGRDWRTSETCCSVRYAQYFLELQEQIR